VAQAYRNLYDTILLGMVDTLSKRPGVVDVKVKEQPGADQVDRQSSVVPPSPSVPSCLHSRMPIEHSTCRLESPTYAPPCSMVSCSSRFESGSANTA